MLALLLAVARVSAASSAALSASSLHDDVRVLRSDSQGLELRYTPAWDRGPLVRAGHCSDADRPRRGLHLALPPGCEPRVTVLASATRAARGPLDEAGFMGDNPEPLIAWERGLWGDLEALTITVELVRVNGPVLSLLESLELRVDFAGGRAPALASRLKPLERAALLNPEQAAGWARPAQPLRVETQWDGTDWVRLPVSAEGLYQITPALLEQVGLQPAQLDPRTMKLYSRGGRMIDDSPSAARNDEVLPRQIPLIRETDGDGVFEAGERLIFYGCGTSTLAPGASGVLEVRDHFYCDVNQYWLLVGGVQPGLEMAPIEDDTGGEPFQLPAVRWRGLLNENRNYGETSARACVGDAFAGGTRAVYTFAAPLSGQATTLRLEYDFYPDVTMLQESLELGANEQVLTTQARPHSTLIEGTATLSGNELRVSVERLNSSATTIYLNWLCPSFEAPARFVNGEISYELPAQPGSYQVQLEQAPAAFWLVDVTDFDSLRVTRGALVTDAVRPLYEGAETGRVRRYFGASETRLRTPSGAARATMPDLKAQAGSAEMIVVAPAAFAEAAAELVAAKNQAGRVSTRLALLEDIYDEFNCGVADPGALRNFLRYEWRNAASPAQYALLAGNGHYDYRGLVAGGAPLRMPVWYNYVNSTGDPDAMIDDYFVRLQADNHVDMMLGRLPANSPEDLRAYTEKLLAYEAAENAGLWRNRLLFVADDEHGESGVVDSFELTHSQDTEELVENRAPAGFDVERLYLFDYPSVYNPSVRVNEKPLAEARLVAALNEGVAFVSFLGHGNNTTWTHEYVFNAPRHFPLIQANGRPAIFVAATCSWAEVDLPIGEAFPQQLINMRGGGAIGVLAATRKTGGISNSTFADQLLTYCLGRDTLGARPSMGFAIREAKNDNNYEQNRRKYIWLGDPSLVPGLPQGGGALTGLSRDGLPADTLYSHSLAGIEALTQWEDDDDPVLDGVADLRARQAPVPRRHDYDPYTEGGAYHNIHLDYESPGALLYAGSTAVDSMRIRQSFVVPADAAADPRPGQLRAYYRGSTGGGATRDGLIYASLPLAANPAPGIDTREPELRLYLNGPQWRPEDWVAPNSQVVLEVSDSSGVNLTGEIGHRLEVEIDGGMPRDLTSSFEYEQGSWMSGRARLELPELEPGLHRLRARAFDNYNNPGHAEAEFRLLQTGAPALAEAACFPNPVGERTRFTLQLLGARPEAPPDCELAVYTVKGRRVAHQRLALSGQSGFLWSEDWRPRNDQGDPLARGVYLARLTLRLPELNYSMLGEDGQYVVRRQAAATVAGTAKMIVR
jgi:hypothetical protein